MAGVNGLVSLSVKLGDIGYLSSLERAGSKQTLVPKRDKMPESPTIRAISGSVREAERKLVLSISRGLKA